MSEKRFYIYVIVRRNGEPCYIGKGTGGRFRHHEREAARGGTSHIARIIRSAGGPLPTVILQQNLTDAQACAYEIAWIAALGREIDGGPLVNLNPGGSSGPSHPAFRETMRLVNTGRKMSNKTKEKIRAANIAAGRKPPSILWTEERRKKRQEIAKRTWTEEMQQKLREGAQRFFQQNPDHFRKAAEVRHGRPAT